jgi:hypothetical protein
MTPLSPKLVTRSISNNPFFAVNFKTKIKHKKNKIGDADSRKVEAIYKL